MQWLRGLSQTALLLALFTPSTTALIHPRRAELLDVALHDVISEFQVPIYSTPEGIPALNHRFVRNVGSGIDGSSAPGPVFNQSISATGALVYWIPVTVGGQEVRLVLDTGSSDSWVVADQFTCLGIDMTIDVIGEVKVDHCGFGPGFNTTDSESFQIVNPHDTSFMVQYVDGSNARGYLGQDIFNVSGVVVSQVLGVVNESFWSGDGVTSGILGLGYPGSIPSTPGHQPYDWTSDSPNVPDSPFDCHDTYPSFVQNLATYGYNPIFSIALNTSSTLDSRWHNIAYLTDGGLLTLGGIPNLHGLSLPFAKAKMNPWLENNTCESNIEQIGYGIEIDGVVDGTFRFVDKKYRARIDTGSNVIILPTELATEMAKRMGSEQIGRPKTYMQPWSIPCDEAIPEFGFIIDDVVISLKRENMLKKMNAPSSQMTKVFYCFMTFVTQDFNDEIILGQPFLREVLAVFDLEEKEIRFSKRFGD
ncbi:hypothetical protein Dda_3669 [Drechslerella dactyloides]|uniref:Peptidase A1 domain-containing protein n=1 Tax=Drechslerella dactyloides TaxID=74499 RepID=A0AAD6IZW4_DREDA|nr:hypothetical protein Dda_3669 [Drechslerella dactyloides]